MASGVNAGAAGNKTFQVQPQMTLGRRLAPPMLGPTHAVGHQLNGGRIDQVNHPFEAQGKPWPPATAKAWAQALQMLQHLPEQLLSHGGVAQPIGMRKGIAPRRAGSADRRQGTGMQLQSIADIIQSQAVGQLRIEQRDDVAPRFIGPRLLLYFCFAGKLWDKVIRNPVANLAQNRQLTLRWLLAFVSVFHVRACRTERAESQRFFSSTSTLAVGRL